MNACPQDCKYMLRSLWLSLFLTMHLCWQHADRDSMGFDGFSLMVALCKNCVLITNVERKVPQR